jgi:hypothetical protein
MLDTIVNYAYIIFVPLIAIAGTIWYMNSHTIISTGPEGEAKGCLGIFITFLLVGLALVTFGLYALAWCIDHWKWIAGGVAILVALVVLGSKGSSNSGKAEAKE